MKPVTQVERALALSNAGWNNCQIERELGVNRRTVSDWVRGRTRLRRPSNTYVNPHSRARGSCPRCSNRSSQVGVTPGVAPYSYAYLLGLYLGDGTISTHPRGVYRLRIFLDRRYPVLIEECIAAIGLAMPMNKVGMRRHKAARMNEVYSFSKHWPHLFPQHGPGPKHKRRIALEPWQQLIADRYPGRLLRGLIHSDGCRVLNRIRHPKKTYVYPRYLFTNRSLDIQRIFCDTCDRLDIAWRQDGPWNISVARKEAVAIMDRHVGPKR